MISCYKSYNIISWNVVLFQATLYVISNNILWFQHACHIMCLKPGKTSLQAEKHYIKLFQLLKKCNFIFNQQSGIQQHGVISSSMTWYQACVISRNIVFDFKKHCIWFQQICHIMCFKPEMHYCKQKHITQATSIIRRVQFQFQSEKWDSHSIVLCVKQQCM